MRKGSLKIAFALGLLAFLAGCSSKKEIKKGVVFEQKQGINYEACLKKAISGTKIDTSFAVPSNYSFYTEKGFEAILWSDYNFGAKRISSEWISNAGIQRPYLQEFSLQNLCSTIARNAGMNSEIENLKKEYEQRASAGESQEKLLEIARSVWAKQANFEQIHNSNVSLTDYLENGNGKPEAFIIPAVSGNKLGGYVFLDDDYVKKNGKPELAYLFPYWEGPFKGVCFSYLGRPKFKKVNGIWCSSFVISSNADFSAVSNYLVLGKFKEKKDFKIEMQADKIDKFNELPKEISDVFGDEGQIIFGFTEWPRYR